MNYPGGKNAPGVYQTIINQMPPHTLYIEAFLGSGAVLRMKRPAIASIAIDSDADVLIAFCDDKPGILTRSDIPDLTVICGDAISWLEERAAANDIPNDAVLYCDPPYLLETRRSQRRIYAHEMTALEHRRLLRCLMGLSCRVILSGYYSDLYATELAGWRTLTYQTRTRGGSLATEWLWMNYPEPFALHDYRYLGNDFRERERIKRQQIRWQARLAHMNPLQRYAMLEVVERLRCSDAISGDAAGSIANFGEGGHPR